MLPVIKFYRCVPKNNGYIRSHISSVNLIRRLQKKVNHRSEVIHLLSCELKSTGDLEDDDVENNILGSSWDIQLENEDHDQ